MRPVAVRILLPPATGRRLTPTGWLEAARALVAERHRAAFADLGATDVRVVTERADGRSFGARLRAIVADVVADAHGRQVGLIVVGGGAMPLARREDREAFLRAAMARAEHALANSWYSADAIAVPDARFLASVPDLPADNALPRWLAERAGIPVGDLRDRSRLAVDLDSPLDVLLLARDPSCPDDLSDLARDIAAAAPAATTAIEGVTRTLTDRRAELFVAGRTSTRALEWLTRVAACRVRALVEERGLRAASPLALGDLDTDDPLPRQAPPGPQRPPRSVLGMVLDERGPGALGEIVAELGDAAVVDSRVLLAHRLGADEAGWPALADRLASDLLAPDDIGDPWLRTLTRSAVDAPIPILLGGHTLVGPGLPLLGRR